MAFDGIVTRAMVREINEKIYMGKIEKVYQPETDELVFNIHTKSGNCKLFASAGSAHARVHLIEENQISFPCGLCSFAAIAVSVLSAPVCAISITVSGQPLTFAIKSEIL